MDSIGEIECDMNAVKRRKSEKRERKIYENSNDMQKKRNNDHDHV